MKLSSILHRKSLSTSIIAMLLISLAMVPMAAEGEINSTGTYFWVDPKGNIIEPYCTQFPVNIMIENAPETYAWEATLNFDNDTLGVMSVTKGTWLGEAGAKDTVLYTTPLPDANKTGTMSIGESLIGPVSGTTGSGLLCTIVFHVEASGRSPLDLQDTALLDMNLVRTEYPNNDGFFVSDTLHDVAILEVTANETTVEQGEPVEITVIIKNQGNYTQTFDVYAYAELETHDPADPDTVKVGDESVPGITPVPQTVTDLAAGANVTLTFNWDTTNVNGEKYTICAEVDKPDDEDSHDNVFIGPEVLVVCPDDIKVVSVTPAETVVPQGKVTDITISVKNEGLNTEDLTVTVFAWPLGGTPFTNPIGSYNVAGLVAGATNTTTFTWNTTTVTPGIYVIGVNAAIIPDPGVEKDLADNALVDGGIAIMIMDGAIIDSNLLNTTVYRGQVALVTVTLENQGTTMYRTPMAILCYNPGDPFGSLVGVITGITLGIGVNLTFTAFSPYGGFPTLPFPPGSYYVCIYLMPVAGWELDTADNGPVIVGTLNTTWVKGDLGGGLPPVWMNYDQDCNYMDLTLFRAAYLYTPQPPLPAPQLLADLGSGLPPTWWAFDGQCNYQDLTLFREAYLGSPIWAPP